MKALLFKNYYFIIMIMIIIIIIWLVVLRLCLMLSLD